MSDIPGITRPYPLDPSVIVTWPQGGSTLQWSFDDCSNTLLGFAVRTSDVYPDAQESASIGWEPGFPEPVTVHPIRAIDRVSAGQAHLYDAEVCMYHWAVGLAMTPERLLAPLMCTTPDELFPEKKLSVGAFFVAQPDDPSGLTEPGLIYGVVGVPNPPWVAALFDSDRVYCGIPR